MTSIEENIKSKINKSIKQLTILHKNYNKDDFYKSKIELSSHDLFFEAKLNPDKTYYNTDFLKLFGSKGTHFQLLFIGCNTIELLINKHTNIDNSPIYYLFADLCYQFGLLLYSYSQIYKHLIFQSLFEYFFHKAVDFYNKYEINNNIASYKLFKFIVETHLIYTNKIINIHSDKFTTITTSLLKNNTHCKYLFYSFLASLPKKSFDKFVKYIAPLDQHDFHIFGDEPIHQAFTDNIYSFPAIDVIPEIKSLSDETNDTVLLDYNNSLVSRNNKCLLACYLFNRYINSILSIDNFNIIDHYFQNIEKLITHALNEETDNEERNKIIFYAIYFYSTFFHFYKFINIKFDKAQKYDRIINLLHNEPNYYNTSYFFHTSAYLKTILFQTNNTTSDDIIKDISSLYKLSIENNTNIEHIQLINSHELYFNMLIFRNQQINSTDFINSNFRQLFTISNLNLFKTSLFFFLYEFQVTYNKQLRHKKHNPYHTNSFIYLYYNKYFLPNKLSFHSNSPNLLTKFIESNLSVDTFQFAQHIINFIQNCIFFMNKFSPSTETHNHMKSYVDHSIDNYKRLREQTKTKFSNDNTIKVFFKELDTNIKSLSEYTFKKLVNPPADEKFSQITDKLASLDTNYGNLSTRSLFTIGDQNIPTTQKLTPNFTQLNNDLIKHFGIPNYELYTVLSHISYEPYYLYQYSQSIYSDINTYISYCYLIYFSLLDIKVLLFYNIDFDIHSQFKYATEHIIHMLDYGYSTLFDSDNNKDKILCEFVNLLFFSPQYQEMIFDRLKMLLNNNNSFYVDHIELLQYKTHHILSFKQFKERDDIPIFDKSYVSLIANKLSSLDKHKDQPEIQKFVTPTPPPPSTDDKATTSKPGFFSGLFTQLPAIWAGGHTKFDSVSVNNKIRDEFKLKLPDNNLLTIDSTINNKNKYLFLFYEDFDFKYLFYYIDQYYQDTSFLLSQFLQDTHCDTMQMHKCFNNLFNAHKASMIAIDNLSFINNDLLYKIKNMIKFKDLYYKYKTCYDVLNHIDEQEPTSGGGTEDNSDEMNIDEAILDFLSTIIPFLPEDINNLKHKLSIFSLKLKFNKSIDRKKIKQDIDAIISQYRYDINNITNDYDRILLCYCVLNLIEFKIGNIDYVNLFPFISDIISNYDHKEFYLSKLLYLTLSKMNSDIINKGHKYTVKRSDTFDTISEEFKLDKDFLVHLNNQAYTDDPIGWRKDMFGKILVPFKISPPTPKAPTPNITSGKKEPKLKLRTRSPGKERGEGSSVRRDPIPGIEDYLHKREIAQNPPSTLPIKPKSEGMTLSSSPTNMPTSTPTSPPTVSPTVASSIVPTATPTTGAQAPSLTESISRQPSPTTKRPIKLIKPKSTSPQSSPPTSPTISPQSSKKPKLKLMKKKKSESASPQPSPPTTPVMSAEEQKELEKELDFMLLQDKIKEKETLLDTINKIRVKINEFKKENKNYTELENKLKKYREQLDKISKDVDELRAKSISSGGASSLFADVDDSEFEKTPDNQLDIFNQIKNYENKKQKEIQDRETEINKQRKKLNDIDFSLDIGITRQLFGIMNYLLNPFDFQKQIYMWDIYQSDIFDRQLDIRNINVQNIQINLREYKRIFGDPIVPQQISAPNDKQEALLKQITQIYKLEYEKINYKMSILTKTFNSS